jgi:mannobiose 2-epimerase
MTEKDPKPARFGQALTLIIIFLLCPKSYALSTSTEPAETYIPRLERILKQNIVPFWYDKSLDRANGGFYDSGPFNAPADKREKVWWVQAEAVVSALRMYRMTQDAKYLAVFERTFDFIDKQLVDWETGEWHWAIDPQGQPQGDKANAWKAGYHNGRAMIECIRLLKDGKD